MLIFKNIFSFGLTWSAYSWLLTEGIMDTFVIVASIQVAICLLSIPMCTCSSTEARALLTSPLDIFGKWNRLLMKRYNILRLLKLD